MEFKYGSNFQPFVNKRDVKDKSDGDLTQEPEMIRAFRDTWELGMHSYLTYLRDRLLLAHDLLQQSGSCFVQINDDNVHLVRNLLDEIFGKDNYVSQISFSKTGGPLASCSRQLSTAFCGMPRIKGPLSTDSYSSQKAFSNQITILFCFLTV
jgi:hypothetical protein